MGDSPWANPQRYISNSPYYRIDRIRTPLLIVAGNKDTTVPSASRCAWTRAGPAANRPSATAGPSTIAIPPSTVTFVRISGPFEQPPSGLGRTRPGVSLAL